MMVEEFYCHLDFVFRLYVHHRISKAKKNYLHRIRSQAEFSNWYFSYGAFHMVLDQSDQ